MSIRLLLTVLLAACTTGPQATVGGSEPDDHLFLDTGTPDIPEQDTSSDPEVDGDSSASPDTGTTQDPAEDTGLTAFEQCFSQILDPDGGGPDYEPWDPTVASHCSGTDHQDIEGVERVVFLGDSVTVGTPPTDAEDWYRNLLAEQLAEEFDLQAPDWFWQNVNLLDGTSYLQESGDFASCAKWGARADDLQQDNAQIEDCFPEEEREKTTLVVMTVGGNDLSRLTEGFMEGTSTEELWTQTEEFMALIRDAVEWFTPERFPGGVHVIFSNLYEFTDATGDVTACPAAELAGYTAAVTDPELEAMVVWSMEQFMAIATDTRTDMLFLLESFCGHGFNYDDPGGRCYRGSDAELWFDETCIHPNATGHEQLTRMFMDVVRE